MSDGLDPRKRLILRAVIVEYVAEGEPVGSEALAQKYELGVRGATIRNELAEMSELGYLEQPHTSAGRIPSDVGYRFFIDHLIDVKEPGADAQQKVRDVAARSEVLRGLLKDTTKILSRMTMQMAAATTSGDVSLRVRTAIVTAVSPQTALVVVVFSNGDAENRIVEIPQGVTLEDFGRLNEHLPTLTDHLSVRDLSRIKVPAASQVRTSYDRLLQCVTQTLRAVGKELSKGQLIVEGEEYIFAQPDLQRDKSMLMEVLHHLEDEETLTAAIQNASEGPMLITIGRENEHSGLRALSILRHDFYIGEEEAGTLAIIGPTRQDYQSSIALLRYTAKAIGDSLSKLLP